MRWRMLALIFFTRTVMGFQFQSVGSLSPWLSGSLGLTLADVGTLIGVYMLPGVFVAIPGGALGNRFGARPIVLTALGLMALGGALAAVSGGFTVLLAARLIAGTGSVLLSLLMTKMVADWFAGREIIAAMGVMLSSWPFGLAAALLVQAAFARVVGWQGVMLATGVLCLLSLTLIALFYRDPPQVAAAAVARFSDLTRREAILSSLAAGVWTVGNIGFLSFLSFMSALLVSRGAQADVAGALASIGIWGSLLAVPLGGFVTQRIGRPNLSITAGALLSAAALAWAAAGGDPLVAGLLLAVSAIPAGATFALPTEVLRPETRAAGFGVFYAWYYLGAAAGPPTTGWIGDRAGSAAGPIWAGAAFCLTGPLLLAAFRRLQHRPAADLCEPRDPAPKLANDS